MKYKTLSMLIAATLSAGALTGCNFYDAPPSSDDGNSTPSPDMPDIADVVVESGSALADAIKNASEGQVIGLTTSGEFASIGQLDITQPITLVSTDEEGNILPEGEAQALSGSSQAVISHASCINIPNSADDTLKGTSGVRIANLRFENIAIDYCGYDEEDGEEYKDESRSRSVINIGKVGNGNTPVVLENLVFDGEGFAELGSDAWIYSRGLVNIADSQFLNKDTATTMDIFQLNCGSNRATGGSGQETGSIIAGSAFSLADASLPTVVRGVVIGEQFKKNQCNAVVKNNTFNRFAEDTTEENGLSAAIADGSGDKATIENNTFNSGDNPVDPPPSDDENVEAVNYRISQAAEGDTVTLAADGDYSSGTIEVTKAIKLIGEDGAKITGSACIYIANEINGAQLSNITFENVTVRACSGSDVDNSLNTKKALLNVGKSPFVELSELTFNGDSIEDNDADAWLFSRGTIKLHESSFTLKNADVRGDILQQDCGSSSARNGVVIENNTFSLNKKDGEGSRIRGIYLNESSQDKICDASVKSNIFTNIEDVIYEAYQAEPNHDGDRQVAIITRTGGIADNTILGNTFN